jgi:hypothetical protein
MDTSTLVLIGSIVVSVLTGGLVALKAVAPHTETKIDDKAVEYGEKALPVMVRVLEWLRSK